MEIQETPIDFSVDSLKQIQDSIQSPTELEELFREIEAFHWVKIQVVDPKEIPPVDPRGYSLDEEE